MDETNNTMPAEKGSSAGPIIGGIVILAVIVFGALYFMAERKSNQAATSQVESVNAQQSSDSAASIQSDLNSTDVNSLDAQMNAS